MDTELDKVEKEKNQWEERVVRPRLDKLKLSTNPTRFYTPLDVADFDFLEKVGFPGQYPFTAGNDPVPRWHALSKAAADAGERYEWGTASAGKYGGFGTPEDYRDYLARMHRMGRRGGPNMAFDLPTQCGYDSDSPWAEGEVGRVGVCVDTFRDFELIYEAYTGDLDIDRISSNFTINAPAAIIIAMYVALAQKRAIPLGKLRGTPQNDVLKEFIARGTQIFPPRPSMRLFRDILLFCVRNLPNFNITSLGGYHMREAGATREQDLAFSMSIGAAYLQAGVDAGLDIDSFAPHFTFNVFGGSVEIYKEIALHRAARRIWARMLKERFGAKNPRSMMIRQMLTAHIGCVTTTLQRPLNNLTRSVIGGLAAGMCGSIPHLSPSYDEPLGLGHSLEAQQLTHDGTRILIYEAKIGEVSDPWAGSYFMESLTDEMEKAANEEFEKIEKIGGAVVATENGYFHRTIAKSAYEKQKRIEKGEDLIVGVNCFTGPHEIEVTTQRSVPEVYSRERMATAGERQKEALARVKMERDDKEVTKSLRALKAAAQKPDENLMPYLVESVKSYATIQEMCDVLREIFGEAQPTRS
jgi:methylmalonyl-CoA mutase N-terminal domain/subunit